MFAALSDKVVDRTPQVYGEHCPAAVVKGKGAVMAVLAAQPTHVKQVEFLENFNVSPEESAAAGALRYTGLVVSLSPDYMLSPADQVWFNGPYAQTTSVYPLTTGKFKTLGDGMMRSDDSQAVTGIYETSEQDAFTGELNTHKFCIVNASAGDLSREKMCGWTEDGVSVRDAYEQAATAELELEPGQGTTRSFDNLSEYIADNTAAMAGEMGACGDGLFQQTTNCFVRAAAGVVHYLNAAAVPSDQRGTLCHVSPLHGFVRLPRVHDRHFYPAALLSADDYVHVADLAPHQRKSVFTRAQWPGNHLSTCNPFALRRPLPNWQSALPQPTEVYRMREANFSLDPRQQHRLSPQAVLAMTPTSKHADDHAYPSHCKDNNVHLHATDALVAQLVAMRHSGFQILNPKYYKDAAANAAGDAADAADAPAHFSLPRHIAEQLH